MDLPKADWTSSVVSCAVLCATSVIGFSSTISIDGSAQQGLPQGPQPPPAEEAAAGQLPPGSVLTLAGTPERVRRLLELTGWQDPRVVVEPP